jgi:hypothetical protein
MLNLLTDCEKQIDETLADYESRAGRHSNGEPATAARLRVIWAMVKRALSR